MEETHLKGFSCLKAAWFNSTNGPKDVWKNEEAFRIEAVAFFVSIPFAVWLGETPFQISVLCAVVLLTLFAEVQNNTVEAVVDRIGPERHELSRITKELRSLSVLLASVLTGLVWLAVLLKRVAN
ncbi:MAG: diacylglycerol kinase [Pseudomonadota bacterium]